MSLYLLTYMAVSSYSNESRIRFRLGEPSRASDLAKFYSKGDDPMILVSFRGLIIQGDRGCGITSGS